MKIIVLLLITSALQLFGSATANAAVPKAVSQAEQSAVLLVIEKDDHTEIQNGVFISAHGEILTVYHGLTHAKRITAHMANGESFAAVITQHTPQNDSATLQPQQALGFATPFLRPHTTSPERGEIAYNLGRISTAEPVSIITGQWLMAKLHLNERQLGNPTLSAQHFSTYNGLIHSGAISQGWSGSPVVNQYGQLLAINHAIFPSYDTPLTLASLPPSHNQAVVAEAAITETAWVLEGLKNYLAWRGYSALQIRTWLAPAYSLDASSAFRSVLTASQSMPSTARIMAAN